MKFSDNVGDLRTFQNSCPIVYATFRPADIRRYVSKSSKNRTNVKGFMAPIFSGETTPTLYEDC